MEDTIQQLLIKLENEWAPAALELGTRIAWYNGLNGAVSNVAFVALTTVCVVKFWKWYTYFQNNLDNHDNIENAEGKDISAMIFIRIVVYGILSVFFGLVTLLTFRTWNFIALFDPKAALAYDIFNGVMKALK